jgi:transcriptional regulator with XRE-family HTH domain
MKDSQMSEKLNSKSSIIRERFAGMLKRERGRLGLTQQEFSKAMGFKVYQMLSKYETCEVVAIPITTYEKFSEVTGISFDAVINEVFCGITSSKLGKNKTHNILSIIDEKDLINLIEESRGDIGETSRNVKYALQIAALFTKLPLLRKRQIQESILRELYHSPDISLNEKEKYLQESRNVYKKWCELV